MDPKTYAVIPAWVFEHYAYWMEHDHKRCHDEALGFFGYNPAITTYIVEEPTGRHATIEVYNQGYLEDLTKDVVALRPDIRIIQWDTDEAKAFYLARVNQNAKRFDHSHNPFAEALAHAVAA